MECRAYAIRMDSQSGEHLGKDRKVSSAAGGNLSGMHKTEKTVKESRMNYMYSHLCDGTLVASRSSAVPAELRLVWRGRDPLPRVRRCTSTKREQRRNLGQRVAGRNQQKEFSRRATPVARERIPERIPPMGVVKRGL